MIIVNDITATASVSRLEKLRWYSLIRWRAYATQVPNELSSKIVLAFPLTLETKVCKTKCLLHTCLVLYKQLLRSEEGHKNRGGKVVALLIFFLF